MLSGKPIAFKLARSHGGDTDQPVAIETGDPQTKGDLLWRRYRAGAGWTRVAMEYRNGTLAAALPWQPPAGKLEYRVELAAAGDRAEVPETGPIITRFKGNVPVSILILHIIAMFGAMLLSTRAGLEFLHPTGHLRRLALWTIGFLIAGGAVLGPIVQKYAFDAYWTGWPFGTDLTDNKTAVALAGWVGAYFTLNRSKRPRLWTALAAVLLLAVFMIPHSVLGSELDYGKTEPLQSRPLPP